MSTISVTPNVEIAPWTDLPGNCVPEMATLTRVGRLPRGMVSGKSSVSVVVTLPDGSNVIAQTSLAMWVMATRAMLASAELEGERYP